jgi:hypothetical protein
MVIHRGRILHQNPKEKKACMHASSPPRYKAIENLNSVGIIIEMSE